MLSRAFLRVASYPSAQPILLQHQPCCSTRPAPFGQFVATLTRSQVAGSQGPHAGIQGQAAGTRQQAAGTRQQAPGSRQGGERSKKMPRQSSKRSFTQADAKITAQCYCFADRFTGVCCLPVALKHAYTNLHQVFSDSLEIVPPSFKSRAGPKVCENHCTVLRFC